MQTRIFQAEFSLKEIGMMRLTLAYMKMKPASRSADGVTLPNRSRAQQAEWRIAFPLVELLVAIAILANTSEILAQTTATHSFVGITRCPIKPSRSP
jgi:hypothetical protein